jgi:hypothetical protein
MVWLNRNEVQSIPDPNYFNLNVVFSFHNELFKNGAHQDFSGRSLLQRGSRTPEAFSAEAAPA